MMWVRLGAAGWPEATYGANDAPKSGMPAFASLTDAELAQVVLYERVEFGGVDPTSEEALELEAIAHGEMTFARSEEHTSELQSLMRNSYAVFCLKKQK